VKCLKAIADSSGFFDDLKIIKVVFALHNESRAFWVK
jgi:hypothetical protein